MSSIKCKNCGLTNFPDANACSRCGNPFIRRSKEQKSRKPSIFALIAFGVVAVIAYYAFGGFEQSMNQVNAVEANRIASQPKQQDAGLSRTEYDQKHAGQYGSAIQNSNSLSENQKHNDEIQKAMNASQGSR